LDIRSKQNRNKNMFDTKILDVEIDQGNIDELACYVEYDPESGQYIGEVYLPKDSPAPEGNFTKIKAPNYDRDVETPIYDKKKKSWKVQTLASPLDDIKTLAMARVDREIKSVVSHHSTVAASNAGLYTMKYNEAKQYLADGKPKDLTDYPFLQTEVTLTGKAASTCANKIIAKNDEWVAKLNEMELIRLGAKKKIAAVKLTKNPETAKNKINELAENAASALYLL
jgi:hypothetical protein